MSGFSWNDGITSSATFGYDAASRLTSINNANATISRSYYNDNLMYTEAEDLTAIGGVARTLSYAYDADGNWATLNIPGFTFTYDYTNRNQLKDVISGNATLASYAYDLRGNVTTRTLNNNTYSAYSYDVYDRVWLLHHYLNGTTRTIQYGYDDPSNNRLWGFGFRIRIAF